MNTARSALSLVIFPPDGGTLGNHPLVCRLLIKGVFGTRPSLLRLQCIGDVAIVLKYLKCHCNEKIFDPILNTTEQHF